MQKLTLPNRLTIARIIAVPIFLISILKSNNLLSILVFLFCVLTDFFDGLIARIHGERTELGSFLDPLADKFLLISSFIVLTALKKIPVWIPIVVITKDIILFVGWWLRFHIIGNTKITSSLFGKTTTTLEMIVVFVILVGIPENIFTILIYVMLLSVIVSTLNYIVLGIKEIERK